MSKRKKINKRIKLILSILLIIIVSYVSITIIKNINNKEITIPILNEKSSNKTKDEISLKLEKLNYTKEEIDLIKKYTKKENINYLINNKINHKIAYNFINETYYIDEYLIDYLNYYTKMLLKHLDILSIW